MSDDHSVYILDMPTTLVVRKLRFFSAMSLLAYRHVYFKDTFLHLAHLNGHLLVILRNFADEKYHYNHVTFHVFRLELPERDGSGEVVEYYTPSDYDWEEVRILQGNSLFLGYSHQFI
ncbi:unnamed protein product [Linum trigynum]|uniref:KIB1-4 beta-propeller domain-containing protein n=1 Tax=Linum trigynum TaxID=586398 RepID=A0AAV2GBJ6_9ROSI